MLKSFLPTEDRGDQGVSPVVAVILMVAVTVALSVAVGVLVFDIGQQVGESNPSDNAGVSISQVDSGTVEVQLVTKDTDGNLTVSAPNGTAISGGTGPNGTNLTNVGDTVTVEGLQQGDEVTVTSGSGGSDSNLVSSYSFGSDGSGASLTSDGSLNATVVE